MLMNKMTQAEALLTDKAYNADERMKQKLKEKDSPVIPSKSNRKNPSHYDTYTYKACHHLMENFFAKLKKYRAIATRHEKTSQNFLGVIYTVSKII